MAANRRESLRYPIPLGGVSRQTVGQLQLFGRGGSESTASSIIGSSSREDAIGEPAQVAVPGAEN